MEIWKVCVEMNSKGLNKSLWRLAVKWGWSLSHCGPNGFNHSVVISSVPKYRTGIDTLNKCKTITLAQELPLPFSMSTRPSLSV